MKPKHWQAVVAVLMLGLLAASRSVAVEYKIVDLGTLGGSQSGAWGINGLGQVVGNSRTASGVKHAFLWTAEGGMEDLGTLGGSQSGALGINGLGQVVGDSRTASEEQQAFLWTAEGGMQDLGTLGGSMSSAWAINDSGWVVGFSSTTGYERRAFLWTSAGGMKELGDMLPSHDGSDARGINESGQAVGHCTPCVGSGTTACLWTKSGRVQAIGTYGTCSARAINDSGQVVGYSDYGLSAFVWTASDGMQDVGTLSQSYPYALAFAISESGVIVGTYRTDSGKERACIWIPATTATVQMVAETALLIMDKVDAGNIDPELEASLLAKVEAAISALEKGNSNDAKVAMTDLKALINQVEAQTDKKITTEVAAEIIQSANDIIAALGS